TDGKTGEKKPALAAQKAPAKAVDHPDDGVQTIPEAPGIWHHRAGEPHGRDVEPELDDERDDVAEVTVLDVEGGDEEGGAEAREHSERNEGRQQHDLPAGHNPVPSHDGEQGGKVDGEVDEGNNGC